MTRTGEPARNNVKTVAFLVAAAAVAAAAPLPAAWVDVAYSTAFYSRIQPLVTSASNRVPFALLDALILIVGVAWIAAFARDARRAGVGRAALAAALRAVSWGAAAYLAFLLLWGLNYRRVPLTASLRFDHTAVTREAARRVAGVAVDRLNALADDAHRIGWRETADLDPALVDGLARAAHDLGLSRPTVGRPKRSLLDLYFRRAGVEGMTDPFFLETLVVSDLLPFERPMVVAHEWAHLAGLAEESSASFAGWLACLHGSPPTAYSGWLFLYQELAVTLPRADRDAVAAALGPRPRADLQASRARVLANLRPQLSAAAWRAYDSYLKTNRVAAGTRSYGEVVQLVLGTRFADDWTPERR